MSLLKSLETAFQKEKALVVVAFSEYSTNFKGKLLLWLSDSIDVKIKEL